MNICDVADVSVIDWDFVMPAPFRVSATSLEHRLFNSLEEIKSSLNPDQGVYFREEMIKLEHERSTSNLSRIYSNSSLNLFLDRVLLWTRMDLPLLETFYPEFVKTALERTPQSLANAAAEWDVFQDSFFLREGKLVPKKPMYVEIQKELGIYNSKYRRFMQGVKQRLMAQFESLMRRIIV
jgi:hypothetical protein